MTTHNPFVSIEERLERIEHLLLNRQAEPKPLGRAAVKHIYGIDGLARLLNCSKPTAQKLKDSGKIPFSQTGRKIVFEEQAVLSALSKSSSSGREGH